MLPDYDMRCAIETCRSSERVLLYIILDEYKIKISAFVGV